ncbi:hypothetical protein [Microbacterium sp.]|uniref:hypothetical protein n=1 Tax=Microbacterium sp. TaxID=51671 RepID=UPI0025F52D51|nr:hypothetical protein [Microbacterium sp.]MBT9608014.1 hypothetical protein [Microbacterium sp.]
MSDDDVELNRLRARVYGETGTPATADEVARLTALEDDARARRASAPTPAAAPDPAAASAPLGDTDAENDDDTAESPYRRPRALAVIAGLTAAGVMLGAGYAAGVAAPAFVGVSPSPSPTPSVRYPELAFPQTDDDVISAGIIEDSGIDPASTRYIAVMRGFRVFLAQRQRGEGVCVVTFTVADGEPWAAGCTTGGPFDDGAVFGIDQHLSIALGDASRMSIEGAPVRLSESVTAFVAE